MRYCYAEVRVEVVPALDVVASIQYEGNAPERAQTTLIVSTPWLFCEEEATELEPSPQVKNISDMPVSLDGVCTSSIAWELGPNEPIVTRRVTFDCVD